MALASDIIARVRTQLIDEAPTRRWTDAELLWWLSDGQRTIAALAPSSVNKVSVVKLVPGTRQTLPADGHMLLTVTRNMGKSGTKPGRAVRVVSREIMDAQNPEWHADPASTDVRNFLYDPQDTRTFFVYPPSNGLGYVEINYAYVPNVLTGLSDMLAVRDIHLTALFDYVMFRAHQKDSDYAAGQALASTYMQAFMLTVTGRLSGELEDSPNMQLAPFNPQVRGAAK